MYNIFQLITSSVNYESVDHDFSQRVMKRKKVCFNRNSTQHENRGDLKI